MPPRARAPRITPKQNTVTPEAAQALGLELIPEADAPAPDDSDVPDSTAWDEIPELEILTEAEVFSQATGRIFDDVPPEKLGDAIDSELSGEIVKPPKEDKPPPPPPSSGIPKVAEWQDFFSRVLIKTLTGFYVDMAFRGIDEDTLSVRDLERIQLTEDERDTIATPFAELASKTPFMRKHGRLIISSANSLDSIVILGMWFSRVNRIARKYKPRGPKRTVRSQSVSNGQSAQNGAGQEESSPAGWNVYNPGSG